MSSAMQQSLGPSSSSMERDARRIHDDTPVSAGNIAIGVVIGRAAEFFDFFVYGIASVVVFPQLFFPFAPDRLTATLYSFAIFRSPSLQDRSVRWSSWPSTGLTAEASS